MSDEIESDAEKAWDADDPRRQADCFAPPKEPCECSCMHCGRTFSSEGIWFQQVINGKDGDIDGFWMCPTNNCGGAGFTFDIFPTDPAHPANAGWHYSDDDDDEEEEEFEDDAEADSEFDEVDDVLDGESDSNGDSSVIDPEDDIPFGESEEGNNFIEEGDEWKLGYAPDQPPPPGIYGTDAMRAEQAKYDEPDERPRVIDRSLEPPDESPRRTAGNDDDDEDIPF